MLKLTKTKLVNNKKDHIYQRKENTNKQDMLYHFLFLGAQGPMIRMFASELVLLRLFPSMMHSKISKSHSTVPGTDKNRS